MSHNLLVKPALAFMVALVAVMGGPQAEAQLRLPKLLVATPNVSTETFLPFADVMAGTMTREFKRLGGVELIDREAAEAYLREQGESPWFGDRETAYRVGTALGADVVIYSSLDRSFANILYHTTLYQITTDTIQRTLSGQFLQSTSPSELGRIMAKDVAILVDYIPHPDELADPGKRLRENTVDPENLPRTHLISEIPPTAQYGLMEQVLRYYRVYPGEQEYMKFSEGSQVLRLQLRDDSLDEELEARYNQYYLYGDFAISHGLQAYFVKNCSVDAINVLIANNIPVFFGNNLLIGYAEYTEGAVSIFRGIYDDPTNPISMGPRDRMVVMFIVPKVGQPYGIRRDYLETAVATFKDEWGRTPALVEIGTSFLEILSGGNL